MEPILCQVFKLVLVDKPPDPVRKRFVIMSVQVPVILDILGRMIVREDAEEMERLREERDRLRMEVRRLLILIEVYR